MTLEEQLFATLGGLFGGNLFPDVAPLDTPKPYGTYQLIGGPPLRSIAGVAGDKRRSLVQLNVWGANRLQVNELMRQVEDAMCSSTSVTDTTFTALPEGELRTDHTDVDLADAPDGLFGAIQDFNVISKR